jgi:hypothetical protein
VTRDYVLCPLHGARPWWDPCADGFEGCEIARLKAELVTVAEENAQLRKGAE